MSNSNSFDTSFLGGAVTASPQRKALGDPESWTTKAYVRQAVRRNARVCRTSLESESGRRHARVFEISDELLTEGPSDDDAVRLAAQGGDPVKNAADYAIKARHERHEAVAVREQAPCGNTRRVGENEVT